MHAKALLRRTPLLIAILSVSALILPASASAVPGALDPTFGNEGIVASSAPGFQSVEPNAVATQPDGKIVVGGTGTADGIDEPVWFVARFNSNGTLDTSFNSTGYAILDWPHADCCASLTSLAITSSGQILAAGTAPDSSTREDDIALARFNPDGRLDTTFGNVGEETLGIPGMSTSGGAMALQLGESGDVADIVVGATACQVATTTTCGFAVARFLADGSPDTTFNSTGYVESSFGSSSDDSLSGVAVDPSGHIFVSGTSGSSTRSQLLLAELDSSGSLDPGFGSAGVELSDLGYSAANKALALTASGDLISAGSVCETSACYDGLSCGPGSCAALAAFSFASGAPNAKFGTDGSTIGPGLFDFATGVAVAPDGTIVAVGDANNFANGDMFAVQRYTPTGKIDTTFGNDGLSFVQESCSSYDYASAVAIEPNGDIVVVGSSAGDSDELILVRLEAGAGTAGTGGCGPPTLAKPPIATITSPPTGLAFTPGQDVGTSFACAEANSYGPGVSVCTDLNLANASPSTPIASGGLLNTYPLGPHTYTVTALSKDGLIGTTSIDYRVADPPSVTVAAPMFSLSIPYGVKIAASYACTDGAGGTGIASCAGTVANGLDVPTIPAGTHYFKVTATSADGLTTTDTIHYRVLFPQSLFTVTHIRTSPDGMFKFRVNVPGPGAVDVMETAWDDDRATAAKLLQPAPDRFVFARGHFLASGAGTVDATVRPNAAGRRLIKHHRYRVVLRLWVTFTPVNGRPRSIGTYDIHL